MRARVSAASSAICSPARDQRALGEGSDPVGVGEHHDPIAGRQRLAVEHPGDVEQLRDLVHRDHAGLPEQGVDGAVGVTSTGLHGDDRLRLGDAAVRVA